MNRRPRPPIALLALLLATACAGPPTAPDGVPWHSPLGHDHPLTGRIWSQQQQRFVPPDALVDHLAGHRHVLLGEKHDNPDHHRLQAWLLRRLVAAGRKPAVLLEMLDSSQQPAIDAWRSTTPRDADALARAVKWSDSEWPDFALYRAVVQAAIDSRLTIAPANAPIAIVRKVAHQGAAGLPDAQRMALGLHLPTPATHAAAMQTEAIDAHCGMLPRRAAGAMATAQRLRDAHMARAMRTIGGKGGSVLIAGNGHTRSDRGVPWHLRWGHLRRAEPAVSAAGVHFVEVPRALTETDAAEMAREVGGQWLWFTARLDNDDPCEKYRHVLEKMRRRAKKSHGEPDGKR